MNGDRSQQSVCPMSCFEGTETNAHHMWLAGKKKKGKKGQDPPPEPEIPIPPPEPEPVVEVDDWMSGSKKDKKKKKGKVCFHFVASWNSTARVA